MCLVAAIRQDRLSFLQWFMKVFSCSRRKETKKTTPLIYLSTYPSNQPKRSLSFANWTFLLPEPSESFDSSANVSDVQRMCSNLPESGVEVPWIKTWMFSLFFAWIPSIVSVRRTKLPTSSTSASARETEMCIFRSLLLAGLTAALTHSSRWASFLGSRKEVGFSSANFSLVEKDRGSGDAVNDTRQ